MFVKLFEMVPNTCFERHSCRGNALFGMEGIMTEKDLKRLSRADLLEMLIDQSVELKKTKKRLRNAENKLGVREIAIDEAGSIAEAALQINGVFEAAQNACEQYMENIRTLSDRQHYYIFYYYLPSYMI